MSVSSCGGLIQYTGELIFGGLRYTKSHYKLQKTINTLCNDGVFLSDVV
jgi:hypothetical protein